MRRTEQVLETANRNLIELAQANTTYGPDQIGLVGRVFASASSAPAFSHDSYGMPLQTTTHRLRLCGDVP